MRVHSFRKLFLFGRYSLALLLPKIWLTEIGVGRGKFVDLEYDRRRSKIILRFNQTTHAAPVSAKSTLSRLKSSKPTAEFQPIPEL